MGKRIPLDVVYRPLGRLTLGGNDPLPDTRTRLSTSLPSEAETMLAKIKEQTRERVRRHRAKKLKKET